MPNSKQMRMRASKLRGSASWMILPAIAMIAPVGVVLDAHHSPARAACAAGTGTYNSASSTTVTLNSACPTDIFNGNVSVTSGSAVYGDATTGWKVTNNASLITSDTVQPASGIYLKGTASTVTNTGTINNTTAFGAGVRFSAAGAVLNNSGLIHTSGPTGSGNASAVLLGNGGSVNNTGTISGGFNGVYAKGAAGTLTNSGNIVTLDTGGFGVWFVAGGKVSNSGTVTGDTTGVGFVNVAGTLLNSGVITGLKTNGASSNAGGYISNSGVIAGAATGAGINITVNSTTSGIVVNNAGATITGGANGVLSSGNGAFTLTNFGTITGTTNAINILGTGAKRVILGEGYKLNGAVVVPAAATLEWAKGSGSLNALAALSANFATIQNDAGATLTSSGNLSTTSLVNQGTLVLSAGNTLTLSGTATLGGTLSVVMLSSPVISTKYTVLTAAGGLSGTFASASSSLLLVTPSLSYDANNTYVTLSQASLVLSGQTANQAATAKALDKAFAANLSGYSSFLSAFDGAITTPEQLNSALDALSGEANANMSSLSVMQGWNLIDLFQQHSQSTMSSEAPDDPWISGFAQSGSFSPLGFAAMHESMAGGVVGADHVFFPGFRGGVMAGMGTQAANIGANGKARTTFEEVAVTADYVDGKLFANGLIGFSFAQGTTQRAISVPGFTGTAIGKPSTDQILLSAQIGYAEPLDEVFAMAPFVQMDFVSANTGAYSETGAGLLNLAFASRTSNSLRSVIGTRLNGVNVDVLGTMLTTELKLAWAHQLSGRTPIAAAAFTGNAGTSFTVAGAPLPRDAAVVGLGLTTSVADNANIFLHYDGQFAGTFSSNALTAGVAINW